MKIGFVGLGNMGTALGNLVASNGHDIIGWEYNKDVVEEINYKKENSKFLPNVELNARLKATNDLSEVFDKCKIVFIAIPSVYIKSTLSPFKGKINKEIILVNLAKGIDSESYLTSFQILSMLFPQNKKLMLSGPSIANEFSKKMPTIVVLAGRDISDLQIVSRVLDNEFFRTRFSDDEVGVELGGLLKNIYAIGLGMFDGKDIKSINFRSAYLTIALEEMTRIGVACGAKRETFSYLSGMGDLIATSLSEHSHNRRFGELLAKGLNINEIKNKMGVLPEGYNTLKTILHIVEKFHIFAPLAKNLWDVVNGRYTVEKFIYFFIKDFIEEERL